MKKAPKCLSERMVPFMGILHPEFTVAEHEEMTNAIFTLMDFAVWGRIRDDVELDEVVKSALDCIAVCDIEGANIVMQSAKPKRTLSQSTKLQRINEKIAKLMKEAELLGGNNNG